MHKFFASEFERTRNAGAYIGYLEVGHPLQRQSFVFGCAGTETDDRCASVVHQIITPERVIPRGEDCRVKAKFPLMIWDCNVCAEDSANPVGKWVSHRFPFVSQVPANRPS
jgi:hypothetical protein